MTAVSQRRSWLDSFWAPFVVPLLFGAAMGAGMLGAGMLIRGPTDAEHKLCDQAVTALLHSKDLVEVQRAGIVIRQVNCGIPNRWAAEQAK